MILISKTVSIKDLVGIPALEGEGILYREYLDAITTDQREYINLETDKILTAMLDFNVSCSDVQDYLSPIVEHILIDAVQEDQETYINLVASIIIAYNSLKTKK